MPPPKIGHPVELIVVEDDADARETLAELLEFCGFSVAACADAAEALGLLPESPDAVLITDVRLPSMDGIALAREAVRRHPHRRVIITSGYPVPSQDIPAAWQWLQKPMDVARLAEAIRQAMA